MDLSVYRNVSANEGTVRHLAEGSLTGIQTYTTTKGAIAHWFSDPTGNGNKTLKADFLAAVQHDFGSKFAELARSRIDPQSTAPLTAAVVRQVIDAGDAMVAAKPRDELRSLHIDVARLPSGTDFGALAGRMKAAKDVLASFGNNWDAARKALPQGEMLKLTEFRKLVVDGLIAELRRDGLNFSASSVGSTAASSDYDITFASPGSRQDIQAMREFNAGIEKIFGKQPGFAFDTNIYVQDYVRVKEKLDTTLPDIDNTPFQPGRVFEASVDVDQHVMGLMKMRRTMDDATWIQFWKEALASASPEDRATLARQYSEADALFVIANSTVVTKLGELGADVSVSETDLPESSRKLLDAETSQTARSMLATQMSFEVAVDRIGGRDPNLLLKARNEAYADVAEQMRSLDKELRETKNPTPEFLAGHHAQRMRLTGQAIFFAAEAYHSAGAVRHVVAGIQGGGASSLSLSDLQTSFMEQIGDARMHSHAKTEPEVAIKASKYMTRVFDALQRILDRPQEPGPGVSAVDVVRNRLISVEAEKAFAGIMGGRDRDLPPPGDIGTLMKFTLLACKKGEIEVKGSEAATLKRILDDTPGIPQRLRAEIDAALAPDGLGKPRALSPEAVAEGRTFATDLLQLGKEEDLLSRMTRVAAQFDAVLSGFAPTVSDQEMRAYYLNMKRDLGLAPDLTGQEPALIRA